MIGFGGMGQRHYTAYQKIGVDVTAICDWDKPKIQKVLPDFSEEHSYNNYKDLLENENFDILSVVSNGPTHAEITINASEHGVKNILCEKPIATSLLDAQKVIDICEKNDTRLAVNHIRRWSSDYKKLKKMIKEDDIIGELRNFYFSCGSTGLGNFTIHFFDVMRYLTDSEPEWALGFLDKTGIPNPRGKQFVDPAGYGVVQFKNGVRAIIDTSEETGVQYLFQIVGKYGRIIIDELNDFWQIRARNEEMRKLPLTRYGAAMDIVPFKIDSKFDIVDLTSNALAELLSDGPISCTGEDSMKALEMVISFHISDEKGNEKVFFPLEEKHAGKGVLIA